MKIDEMMENAYMTKKDDGKGFKKLSDAIPNGTFKAKSSFSAQNQSNGQKQSGDFGKPGFQKQTSQTSLPKDKDSVYRRVAKFLVMIGENEAAKILPHLSEEQIMKIVPEIASVRSVSREEQAVILAEFKELMQTARMDGGVATAKEMLVKAYGEKRAEEMLQKAVPFGNGKPFEYLADSDKERIYELIKDEGEGVQTIVLSHLEPKKAAAVINCMTADEKKLVVLRMAKMEPISPEVVSRIDKSLHEKSLRTTAEKSENIDGRNALAQILKRMDSTAEKEILSSLEEADPTLSDDIKGRLFTIDDVVRADNRIIQRKLRDMENSEIVCLIAGKSPEFREKILGNVSSNRRELILSDAEVLGPFRKSEVNKATEEFISYLRRAFDEGSLLILGRNEEDYV